MLLPKKKRVKSQKNYDEYRRTHHYCEVPGCGEKAVDCHHIKFKSQGGDDVSENFIALCRPDHDRAHGPNSRKVREEFLQIKSSE